MWKVTATPGRNKIRLMSEVVTSIVLYGVGYVQLRLSVSDLHLAHRVNTDVGTRVLYVAAPTLWNN